MTTKKLAELTADAVRLFDERLNQLEARVIADGLMITALIETHPDLRAVVDALDACADPKHAASSKNPKVVKAAQERIATLADAYRKALQPEDSAG